MSEPRNLPLKISFVLCFVLVVAITLTAGLWPFAFRIANNVEWLPGQGGLKLKGHSEAFSASPFAGPANCSRESVSFELWIEPERTSQSATILAVSSPLDSEQFIVLQRYDALKVVRPRGRGTEGWGRMRGKRALQVNNSLTKGKPLLVSVTTGKWGTAIFEDGKLRRSDPEFGLTCRDLSGILILGASAVDNDSWRGKIFGFAMYNRSLGEDEVKAHFEDWTRGRSGDLGARLQADTLYVFDEGEGTEIRDHGPNSPPLQLPENYSILHKEFLDPFWKEFRPDRAYVQDFVVNVVGLMPLGYCSAALLSWLFPRRHTVAYTALFCFLVSLTIEVLQGYMPLRNSGTTDLFTNTAGGVLGAMLFLSAFNKSILKRSQIIGP